MRNLLEGNESYDDEYATCADTHVSLCIYHMETPVAPVAHRLGLTPDSASERGIGKSRPASWILESETRVDSLDIRRHIDWLLVVLDGKESALAGLRADGYTTVVSCKWDSARGHGGPMLWARQMAAMGRLGLEIWFDFYAVDDLEGFQQARADDLAAHSS